VKLGEYYESRKKMVDDAVRSFLEREGLLDLSPTPLGGKRLRGVLTILVCEALGGRPEAALDAAIAIELAHAASLDADDIVDLDVLRRGKPATWVLKGLIKTAVGTHGLVAAALNLVKKYGFDAVNVFTETYAKMVRGEIKDVLSGGVYEAIIGAKTASLWAAGAALGAIAAGRKDFIDHARRYGYAVGMAFQIADDIVDTVKIIEKMEFGKLLQPSVMAFITYLGLEALLQNPFKVLMRGIQGVKNEIQFIAVRKLDDWIGRAKKHAEAFPDSEYKKLLIEYPELAVDLMVKEGMSGERGGQGG